MVTRIDNRQGGKRWWRPLAMVSMVGAAAFALGTLLGFNSSPRLVAGPPAAVAAPPAVEPEPSPDYMRRVVARIHDKVDITREELGEYLIARYGVEKLDLLINKRIIEHACQEKKIDIAPAEVEAALDRDCADLGVDRRTFITQVLKKKQISLYEWKEDVIKPRLQLARFCHDQVKVTDEDVSQAFENHYGEKVDCRIILYPKDPSGLKVVYKIHEMVRASDEEFERAARSQPNPHLAATGGAVKPVSRHSGNDVVEKIAFSLRPGEVSQVIDTPEGYLIMKCVKRINPDRTKVLENEKAALSREVYDRKIAEAIPKVVKELQDSAKPMRYLKDRENMADLERAVREELKDSNLRMPPESRNAN